MGPRVTSERFVGRRDELAALRSAHDDALAGVPSTVLLGGDAGVGKTRLVREFLADLHEDTLQLAGACVDLADGAAPYAGLVAAFRGLRSEFGDARLRAAVGGDDGLLRPLMPWLAGPARPMTAVGPNAPTPGRVYEAALALITAVTGQRPTALVVEDVHWADRSTRDLLGYLARNLTDERLLLLLTYRSDELHRTHPLRPWLAEFARVPGVRRVDLRPLSREESVEQVTAICGAGVDAALVEHVVDRAEGNPFYAEELLVAAEGGAAPLPSTIRDSLLTRLERLSPTARSVVRIAAVAGREVEHDLLAAVAERLSPTELTDGLREAVTRHVLLVDPQDERYQFRHALLQETVYQELLPGERVAAHAAFATALERDPTRSCCGPEAAATELAVHWAAARDADRAFSASLAAARDAERIYAFAEALQHHERALELWSRVADDVRSAAPPRHEVLYAAARLANELGDPRRAYRHLEEAAGEADALGDARLHAHLLGRMSYVHYLMEDIPLATATLERALEEMPTDPSSERAWLLGWYGRLLMLQGRPHESLDHCRAAIATAEHVGAVVEESHARNTLATSLGDLGDLDAAFEEMARARELAFRVGDEHEIGRVFVNTSALLCAYRRHEEAVAVADEGVAWGDRHHLKTGVFAFLRLNAIGDLWDLGRWEEAERRLRNVVTGEEDLTRSFLNSSRAIVLAWRGDLPAAVRAAHALPADHDQLTNPHAAHVAAALATIALLDDRPADTVRVVETALAPREMWQGTGQPATLVQLGARAAGQLGRRAAARGDGPGHDAAVATLTDLIERGEAYAAATGHEGVAVAVGGAAALARAERSDLLDGPDPATWAALDEAPLPPHHRPYVAFRQVEALLATDGDRAVADDLLRTARADAARLGEPRLLAEIDALARRARLQVVPTDGTEREGPADGLGLTPREREVLELVAEGRTNREIGERLFISAKTASVHVSNILAKLGASNRSEAAAVGRRAGLVA